MNTRCWDDGQLHSLTTKEITAEHIKLFAFQRVPHYITRGVDIKLEMDPFDDGFIARMVGSFNSTLVKEHIEDGGTEETEERLPSDVHWLPARPVDHLIEFLRAYLPTRIGDWLFLRFYEEKTLPVEKVVLRQTTKKKIHKHYHLIPRHIDQMGDRHHWRYLSWKDDYYTGSSEEWGDLVRLRDAVLATRTPPGDWEPYTRIHNLEVSLSALVGEAYKIKRKSEYDRSDYA